MFIDKVKISSNDTDAYYNLKAPALYMMFQDAAMKQTVELGVDAAALKELNLDWIITRMDVEIYKTPSYRDELTIRTYPGPTQMCFYPRYFEVLDGNGDVVIKASSIWALLDHTTRRIAMNKDLISDDIAETHEGQLANPRKLAAKEVDLVDERKIYYSEIDLNGHLNNCSYIKLLVDAHDVEFYKTHEIIGITTNYNKEVYAGSIAKIYSKMENNIEYFEVKVNDEIALIAEVRYKEK